MFVNMEITMTFVPFEETDVDEYDNYTNSSVLCDDEEEELGLHTFRFVFQPLLYCAIFLLGAAGNGLMIAVLLRRRHRLRITEIYLLHLAVADLLLLLAFPFDVADGAFGWVFGDFLCMLRGVLRNLNVFCGSFLLACIGFDRYLAIVHAIPSMQSRRPGRVHLTCGVLWVVCFLLSTPNAAFLSVATVGEATLDCDYYRFELHAHNWVVANRVLHHVCFFSSLTVMSYCYAALVVTLCRSQKREAKRGAIRLALLVTSVFCVCWLPYNVAALVQTVLELDGMVAYDSCGLRVLMRRICFVTETLGLSHCCLNPFLYAFAGAQFRAELVALLCRLGCCHRVCRAASVRDQGSSRIEATVTNSTTCNN